MKTKLLLFTLLMSGNYLTAQIQFEYYTDPIRYPVYLIDQPESYPLRSHDTVIQQVADTANPGMFLNRSRQVITKDPQGSFTFLSLDQWDPGNAMWAPLVRYEMQYTYNASNEIVHMRRIFTAMFGGSTNISYRQANYTYDGNGNITRGDYVDSLDFGGNWIEVAVVDSVIYNGNNQLTERYLKQAFPGTPTPENDTRYRFYYDSNGEATYYTDYHWDNSVWAPSDSVVFVTDASGNRLRSMEFQEDNNAWAIQEQNRFHFGGSNNLVATAELGEDTNDIYRLLDSTSTVYDSNGDVTEEFQYKYVGGSWVNYNKSIPTYNSSGELEVINYYKWNGAGYNTVVDERIIFSENTVVATPPAAPSNLMAAATRSAGKINLTWNDNSADESGFVIERKLSTGSYVAVDTVNTDVTMFLDGNLLDSTEYFYRVVSYNQNGTSAYSNEVSAITFDTLSSGLIETINGRVNCYPNPFKEALYIKTGLQHNAVATIINSLGDVVLRQNVTANTRLNTTALAPGVYFLSIVDEGGPIAAQKLIKHQ